MASDGPTAGVKRLGENVVAGTAAARERLRSARATWGELSGGDLRVRLGGAFVGGLLIGRVVRHAGH